MNVRLEYELKFIAGAYLNRQVMMNQYRVQFEMITQSYDGIEQNIALDRVRHMLYKEFASSVFVDGEDLGAVEKLETAGLKVVVLPDVPVDQIIGIMLYCKLNAVMEQRMLITQLKISSDLGQRMIYCQDEEEDIGPFEPTGWWHEGSPNVFDKKFKKHKIVKLVKNKTWTDVNLGWNNDQNDGSTVITFDNDEQK
jgi:hypothetical protein